MGYLMLFSAKSLVIHHFFRKQEIFCLASHINAIFTNTVCDILHSIIRTRDSVQKKRDLSLRCIHTHIHMHICENLFPGYLRTEPRYEYDPLGL